MNRRTYLVTALEYMNVPHVVDCKGHIWLRGVAKQNAVILDVRGADEPCSAGESPLRYVFPQVLNEMDEDERQKAEEGIMTLLQSMLSTPLVFPKGAENDKDALATRPSVV